MTARTFYANVGAFFSISMMAWSLHGMGYLSDGVSSFIQGAFFASGIWNLILYLRTTP